MNTTLIQNFYINLLLFIYFHSIEDMFIYIKKENKK